MSEHSDSFREDIIARLEDLKKGQYELHKLITGNGKVEEGVLYRLKIVETSLGEFKKDLHESHRRREYWLRWAVGGSIAAVASSAFAWVSAHTKITP